MREIHREIVRGTLDRYKVIEVDHDRWMTDIARGYVGLQDGNNNIFYIINNAGRAERIVRGYKMMDSDLTVEHLSSNLSRGSGRNRRYFLITPENIASEETRSYILTRIPRRSETNRDFNYQQYDRPVTFSEELV
jgi:hypothetical protein